VTRCPAVGGVRDNVARLEKARYCIESEVVVVEKVCAWGWEGWERLSCAPWWGVARMMSRVPKDDVA